MTRWAPIAVAGLAWGCGSGARTPAPAPPGPPPAPAPRDSLVLTTPSGHQVWFTAARPATDSLGAGCVERGVEIRTDSSRVVVPLLFTNRAPVLLDPGHLRAELTRNCVVVGVYRVDLATGRPTRIDR